MNKQELKKLLIYNPKTGMFTWKVNRYTGKYHNVLLVKKGDKAGNLLNTGYLQIMINKKTYTCHRLAWLYMTGNWPINNIDHINGIRDDNRWENLRDVTQSINMQNEKKARITNKLGVMGVGKARNRFRSYSTIDGKYKHIGTYDSKEEAHEAYLEFKRENHKGFIP